jgi:hypothetical protein
MVRSKVSQYPKFPALLAVLAAVVFVASSLQARLDSPPIDREITRWQREAPSYQPRPTEPAITCTAGRAGFIRHAGRQHASIEMVLAHGVAYVVLGGVIFALVACFRLLSDRIDSFFALLIPEPTDIQDLRTVPLDEDFSPFKFEQVRKPSAKLKSSDLASGRPPEAATSAKFSIRPALEVLQPFPRARRTSLDWTDHANHLLVLPARRRCYRRRTAFPAGRAQELQ